MKTNTKLLRHECIHHRQQTELFILPFYVLYGLNYVFNLFRYRNHLRAYREIVFEREAFANDAQRGYLAKRKAFAFMEYLFSKQG